MYFATLHQCDSLQKIITFTHPHRGLKLQWYSHLLGVEEMRVIHVSETDGLFRDSAMIV